MPFAAIFRRAPDRNRSMTARTNMPRPLPWVNQVQPYLPGETAVPGVTEVVKLSSNESLLGPSSAAVQAAQRVSDLGRYPDPDCVELKTAIADRYGVRADRIVCEAGSEQLINLLARAYAGPGDEVLYPEYSFIAYRIAAQSCGATRSPRRRSIRMRCRRAARGSDSAHSHRVSGEPQQSHRHARRRSRDTAIARTPALGGTSRTRCGLR